MLMTEEISNYFERKSPLDKMSSQGVAQNVRAAAGRVDIRTVECTPDDSIDRGTLTERPRSPVVAHKDLAGNGTWTPVSEICDDCTSDGLGHGQYEMSCSLGSLHADDSAAPIDIIHANADHFSGAETVDCKQ